MKNLSKILLGIILALSVALTVACTGGDSLPNFINPEDNDPGNQDGSENKYTVSIVSEGGLPLNNVRVSASKNGEVLKNGISVNGAVQFDLPLDEYVLSFDNLPAGYYLPEGVEYVTSATDYKMTATFKSGIISTSAPSNTLYSVGDIIHDFNFRDSSGNTYTLSSVMEGRNTVVINFWYKNCGPCRAEFPAIESAYRAYSDKLGIVAITNQDSLSDVQGFQEELGLTFNLGQDIAGITNLFGVRSFPTTVIVDRYGAIAHIESGSQPQEAYWKSVFANYTSDSYKQVASEDDDQGGDSTVNRVKPNIKMPASEEFEAVLNNDTFSATYRAENDEYSWPWIIKTANDGSKYVASSNTGIDNSYAILLADLSVKGGDMLSFDYYISSEENYDLLYVIMDGELAASFSGQNDGWNTYNLHVFNTAADVELAFVYLKDTQVSSGDDFAGIRNVTITSASDSDVPIDILRDCATNLDESTRKYTSYTDVQLGVDGLYHVKQTIGTGAIILADVRYVTPWTRANFDGNVTENTEFAVQYYSTPYYISFWEFPEAGAAEFVFNGTDYTDLMIDVYNMQGFSTTYDRVEKNSYGREGMVPVTEEIRAMLQDFAIEWARRNTPSSEWNEDSVNPNWWLEFCYYFDHYGDAHANGIECCVTTDAVKGMYRRNAFNFEEIDEVTSSYDAYVKEAEANGDGYLLFNEWYKTALDKGVIATADIWHELGPDRGVKYKITAPKAGVYRIKSLYDGVELDPFIFVFGDRDTEIYDSQDEAMDYDKFNNEESAFNFKYYVYLEEGESVYVAIAFQSPQVTGVYDFELKYVGETFNHLRWCTTAEGAWTYDEITGELIYGAINVAYSQADGYYRAVTADYEYASPIYIDFTHSNYFDQNGHSLYEMIEAGIFDDSDTDGGANYTQKMLEFYNASIEGKTKDDELYGMHLATQELVDILNRLIFNYQEEGASTQAWRSLACYYVYHGPAGTEPWNV